MSVSVNKYVGEVAAQYEFYIDKVCVGPAAEMSVMYSDPYVGIYEDGWGKALEMFTPEHTVTLVDGTQLRFNKYSISRDYANNKYLVMLKRVDVQAQVNLDASSKTIEALYKKAHFDVNLKLGESWKTVGGFIDFCYKDYWSGKEEAELADYMKEKEYNKSAGPPGGGTAQDSPANLAYQLPGIKEKVTSPCENCEHVQFGNKDRQDALIETIMHLNDAHHWTREAIADWLDSLDINLKFTTPKENDDK